LIALTKEAADVTGIPYVMDSDKDEVERILVGCGNGKYAGKVAQ
jgi:hypothetical protein